ncbi:MAG: GIY-YIG nuclease family protein [Patescibacteria group bacterium]|nr:GIY-YIG nuclease family protein [Patescibacteria group bacterium]
MFYVYILKSKKDNTLYKGFTENLKKRFVKHNSGEGSIYSSTKKPYELIWYCAFANKRKALKFERYLKHGSGYAFTNRHFI